MALITIPNVFSSGAVIVASQHNSNFSTIATDYNGNIDNNNIATNAAIAYSKLNLTGNIVNADVSTSAAIVYSKLNLALGIVNADVSASAAIVDTKLAQITTASKVSGTAITGLASLPAGAGVIPSANVPAATSKSILTSTISVTTGVAIFICPGSTALNATQTNVEMPFPVAATIKNLYIKTSGNVTSDSPVTVYKNASSQTLTATVTNGTNTANDTTHNFTVVAGDTLTFGITNNSGGTIIYSISVEVDI